jgi:quinoprotein glucose dehydrogenase
MTYESDVCIIGGGITAAMLSEKLSELRPGLKIVVVEAGQRIFDFENRMQHRERSLEYGENAWPGDFIEDQAAQGIISRTMAVGGSALHWGGVTNRFSEEDLTLHSSYGLAADWPVAWADLERHYGEAERRLGVSGEASPLPEDRMSSAYPMRAMPLSYNLRVLKAWANESGIPFWSTPQAKNTRPYGGRSQCMRCNTCEICPTGARYSPDFTFKQLLAARKIELHDRVLVRKLVTGADGKRVVSAEARSLAPNGGSIEYRARSFVVASGYCWSSHLLLLSASPQSPGGLANRSGLVGRYMTGHAYIGAQIELDATLYPGMNEQHSLISRKSFRCAPSAPYVRHDLRVWESSAGRDPRLADAGGKLMLGDGVMADWRARTVRGAARVRAYYDVHPSRESTLTLDPARRNRFGDPLPIIRHVLDDATKARAAATKAHIAGIFNRLAKARNGRVFGVNEGSYLDHPSGGCRMGTDPSTSVVDSHGRTHDHDDLFVVGSPTLPTGGCTNATLTFVALALRSATQIA